ncbi:MAG: methylated-DNA--[protein]-cysteine S-methyltransferase [Clostridiaceae bacterium]
MNNAYTYETKIGKIMIVENGCEIIALYFRENIIENINIHETSLLKKANQELQEYFQGKRKSFSLPIKATGTEFQQKVWKELQNITYGKTSSYKEIAERIGNEKASRAVGMANNKNPIPIIIPCHRVIGTNGKLVGYAGGLDIKEKLLEIENRNIDN